MSRKRVIAFLNETISEDFIDGDSHFANDLAESLIYVNDQDLLNSMFERL